MDIHNCCKLCISIIHILVFLFFGTPPPPPPPPPQTKNKDGRLSGSTVLSYYHKPLYQKQPHNLHNARYSVWNSIINREKISPGRKYTDGWVYECFGLGIYCVMITVEELMIYRGGKRNHTGYHDNVLRAFTKLWVINRWCIQTSCNTAIHTSNGLLYYLNFNSSMGKWPDSQ